MASASSSLPHGAVFIGGSVIAAALILSVSAGCSPFTAEEKPVPDSTFADVLTEFHLAKARWNVHQPLPRNLRDSILARYGIRWDEFSQTLNYYSNHPSELEALYETIVDTLRAAQHTLGRGSGTPPQNVPDSLRQRRQGKTQRKEP